MKLSDFDAVTFDFYGTIVNWEPEVLSFLRRWTNAAQNKLSDEELLGLYDGLRRPIQEERPAWRYPEVLRRTLDAMSQELGCDLPSDLREEFGRIAATHKPFPDSVGSIRSLQDRGFVTGALSNIDDASFREILRSLELNFDVIVTAERVGSYKPDMPHFLTALSDLRAQGIEIDRVLHVAQSRYADIAPANQLGLSCVWVDRKGAIFGRRGGGAEAAIPTVTVSSLEEVLTL